MDNALVKSPWRKNLRITEFKKRIEDKYGVKLEDYWKLHKWSVEHLEFWGELWEYLPVISSVPYSSILEPDKKFEDIPEWFPGSRLNFAENLLRCEDGVALILDGEEWPEPEFVTYSQLRDEVATLSCALRKAGIKSGDIISCFMSNRAEAVTSMLAAATIGALYSATNPLMGAKAVVSRFQQVSPKVLFTIDRFLHDKGERDILSLLPSIVENLPSLELVVIVPSKKSSAQKGIGFIRNSCSFPDFLKTGLEGNGEIPASYYEQLPYSHPFIINFTSGTTGPPKGIVHSVGGALLGALKDLAFHYNITSSDVMLCFYSTGWMSWNFFVCALAFGATLLIYDGVPFFHYKTAFWDLLDRHGVTVAFIIPVILEELEKRNFVPGPLNHLKQLHTLASGSCHVKSHTYDFVDSYIKHDVNFTVGYGSTETMSMLAGINYCLSIYKEELQSPSLGTALCCYNEAGEKVLDTFGEVVFTKPFASMPLHFWKDEGNKKYKTVFFNKFLGVWSQADMCIISSKTGGIVIFGRADETIKQRGSRFGSAEIYGVVNKLEEIEDSLCVSRITEVGDEIAVLFVQVKSGYSYTSELVERIKKSITEELSLRHVPEVIVEVKEVPYNVNGKRMEVLVKKILSKSENISLESAANPECLIEYRNFANLF